MFTRFRYHWAETCHCAEFSFTWLKSFKLKHLNWAVFHRILFPVSSTVVTHWSLWSSTTSFGHWRALWPPWLPPLLEPTLVQLGELNSSLLSLTRHCQSYGQHTAPQPTGLWDCHHCRGFGTHTSEAHDLLFITQSIMTADQIAKNESALLWAQTCFLLHWWLVAWLMDSIDFFFGHTKPRKSLQQLCSHHTALPQML